MILIILVPFNSYAEGLKKSVLKMESYENHSETTGQQDAPPVAAPPIEGKKVQSPKPPAKAEKKEEKDEKNEYVPTGLGRSADYACQQRYIGRRGRKYGSGAQLLIDEILASPMKDYFFNRVEGMEDICPNFDSFSQDQKLNFWVVFFAHVGDFESDCRPGLLVSCTNGACGGEFQVPEQQSRRAWRVPREYRKSYRGKGCSSDNGSGRGGSWTTNEKNGTACAVQIMAGQLCGFYRSNSGRCVGRTSPFGRGYWQPINEGKIYARMKSFPLCEQGSNK